MKRMISGLQDNAALLLGLEPQKRTPLIHNMLHRPRGDAAGYWLQLAIAALLATLGLALDSTAVVIGAMLVAPLMRPIVELAMGLATGSAPLVFRTGQRALASVATVVIASAAITLLLPFHEVTPELAARTAPSILDLFVAAACALAGAYAVVNAGNDMATTAAGTSIGISLVPPLCTVGYGLSNGDWDMAIGAALLFTANITGIIIVASALFVVVGFGQVNIREEEDMLDDASDLGTATRIGRVVSTRSSRLGAPVRVVVPLLLLGAIAFPLTKAVKEMSKRSAVRQHIASLMSDSSSQRVVQYSLDQAARPTVLRVVIVGDATTARQFEHELRTQLAALGETSAAVSVWAVSDATAVSALSSRLDDVPKLFPQPAPPPPPPPPPSLEVRVRSAWPKSGGEILDIWTTDGGRARVAHLGPEIGQAARDVLAKAVAIDGALPVVEERAYVDIELGPDGLLAWLERTLALIESGADIANLRTCLTVPAPRPRARPDPTETVVRQLLERVAKIRATVAIAPGPVWHATPTTGACAPPVAPSPPTTPTPATTPPGRAR